MTSDWQDDGDPLAPLGKPVGEFRVSGYVLLRRLALAFFMVIGGVGLTVLLIAAAKIHHFHVLCWGVLLAVMGLMMGVRSYRNYGLRVFVYPEGGILYRGDRAVTFFWEEITRVWRQRSAEHWSRAWQGSLVLVIEKGNGETISLDDGLPGLLDLASLVEKMTLGHLLTASLYSLESGVTLDFGDLTINSLGLHAKNQVLPWKEVGEIQSEGGSLTIFRKGKRKKWHVLPVASVPNHHVVQSLVLKFKEKLFGGASGEIKKGVPLHERRLG
jgi:hypothetical protein